MQVGVADRGMYVTEDSKPGQVVHVECMRFGVPWAGSNDETLQELAYKALAQYPGWKDSGLSIASWAAENEGASYASPEEKAATENWVAACNIMAANSFERTLGPDMVTHKGFAIGGCFFNACNRPNADAIVSLECGVLVLRIVLHDVLKAGQQVYLGYKVQNCACGTNCVGATLPMGKKAIRQATNLDIMKACDQEMYMARIERLASLWVKYDQELPEDQVQAWVAINKPTLDHVREHLTQGTSSK